MKAQSYTLMTEEIRNSVAARIRALPIEPLITVRIETHKKRRTLSQNGLYWRWVEIIREHTGNSKTEIHDILRDMFLEPQEIWFGDQVKLVLPSTADLEPVDFGKYLDQIQAMAATDLGLFLPSSKDERLYK